MISTVLPLSTSWLRTLSKSSMSWKCRPVVGSSRMYRVRPVLRRDSSSDSLTRCASPPDSVVALCPSRMYDRPTSISVCSLRAMAGTDSKYSSACSTVRSSTSLMLRPR
ncbi:Uncharacterised protein [Bordetella pertussis]|nr:Uncharacterised protein [Bordetella pertussis]CPL39318.1 Uncharacterised protein [Bordetella pertussis]